MRCTTSKLRVSARPARAARGTGAPRGGGGGPHLRGHEGGARGHRGHGAGLHAGHQRGWLAPHPGRDLHGHPRPPAVPGRGPAPRAQPPRAVLSCPRCGGDLPEDAERCEHCGHRVAAAPAARAEEKPPRWTAGMGCGRSGPPHHLGVVGSHLGGPVRSRGPVMRRACNGSPASSRRARACIPIFGQASWLLIFATNAGTGQGLIPQRYPNLRRPPTGRAAWWSR